MTPNFDMAIGVGGFSADLVLRLAASLDHRAASIRWPRPSWRQRARGVTILRSASVTGKALRLRGAAIDA